VIEDFVMEDKQHPPPASVAQNWIASQAAKKRNKYKTRGVISISDKYNSVKNQYLSSNLAFNSNDSTGSVKPKKNKNTSNKNKPLQEEEDKRSENNTENLSRPQSAVAWREPQDTDTMVLHDGENIDVENIPSEPSGQKISDKPPLLRHNSIKNSRTRNGRKSRLSILLGVNTSSATATAGACASANVCAQPPGQSSDTSTGVGAAAGSGSGPSAGTATATPSPSGVVATTQYPLAREGSRRRRSDGETYKCISRGNLDRVRSFQGDDFESDLCSEEEKDTDSMVGSRKCSGPGSPGRLHTSTAVFPTEHPWTDKTMRQHSPVKPQPFQHASAPACHQSRQQETRQKLPSTRVSKVESDALSTDRHWYDWPIRVLRQGQVQGRPSPITTNTLDVKYDGCGTAKSTPVHRDSSASSQGEDRLFATRVSKEQSIARARSSQLSHAKSKSKLVAYDLSSDDELDMVKSFEKVAIKPVARRKG